jgi:hypothetical protein
MAYVKFDELLTYKKLMEIINKTLDNHGQWSINNEMSAVFKNKDFIINGAGTYY